MSATDFVTAVPVFEGAQGRFYLVDGEKYSVYFPIAWAHTHLTFEGMFETGPKNCSNCKVHGSIREVFVGYCSNCLKLYHKSGYWRGCLIGPGLSIDTLKEKDLWNQYPYLCGIHKYWLGDEEDADLRDNGINLEELSHAN